MCSYKSNLDGLCNGKSNDFSSYLVNLCIWVQNMCAHYLVILVPTKSFFGLVWMEVHVLLLSYMQLLLFDYEEI